MILGSGSPRNVPILTPDSKKNMLQKPMPYDAPERVFVNQKDIGIQADVWSLGVVLYEFLVSVDGTKKASDSVSQLRQIPYEDRVKEIRANIRDVAMQELLFLMLRDHENRPTAEQLLDHPILRFFGQITR